MKGFDPSEFAKLEYSWKRMDMIVSSMIQGYPYKEFQDIKIPLDDAINIWYNNIMNKNNK